MTEEEVYDWLFGVAKEALQFDPELTVSEWADRYRILSEKASNEPGPWRTSRTPYLRDIMDALSSTSPYETVVFMKGAQIGASEMGFNWIGYIIDNAPGPTLLVMPTVDTMKDNSRIRIDPMIQDCPQLQAKIGEAKSKDSSNTTLMKEFPGGFLSMIGANSPVGFRSKPCRYVFADEVDGYPGDVGGEGDPISLLKRAMRTFKGRRKLFLASTPKIAGMSRVEDAYLETDRRHFYVPCPHCGGFQILTWPHMHWEKGRPDNAWYECEFCGKRIYNQDKTDMLARGEWRPEVKNYRGKAIGFHLSSLYSPVGWMSWGEMAVEFSEATHKKDQAKLKTFINLNLGETWQEQGEVPEWEKLYYRREGYAIGKVPAGGLFLTAACDVHPDRLEVEVMAWGRDKENWSIDYRVFPGNTSTFSGENSPWRRLDALMSEGFEHESGLVLTIRCLAIDTGNQTQTVYNWCRRYPVGRVMPVKGQASLPMVVGSPRAVDVYTDGKRHKGALKLWSVGVSVVKAELYGWLRLPKPDAGMEAPAGYCHFPEYEEEYFQQLTAEQLVKTVNKTTHKTVSEWKQMRDRNESLDTHVYNRAAASQLNIDRFTPSDWDKLERSIWPNGRSHIATPVANPVITQQPVPRTRKRRILSRGLSF